jgi:PTH1 family peptidyl-tRNA hydrolase
VYLIVGLGNPGREYERSRHNLGFAVVDLLAARNELGAFRKWNNSLVVRGSLSGVEVYLAKPTTYMNLSGEAVGSLVQYYKLSPRQVIVVHDELDFPPGEVRIKVSGGAAGHNGVQSIISHIGPDFARVRMGIGKPESAQEGAQHVLSPVDASTRQLIDAAILTAADAVEAIVSEGIASAMSHFNRRANDEDDRDED